jgi:methionyl-tRNA formyltransferase
VLRADKSGIEVACLTGSLIIKEMQLAGKKRLDAASFLSGYIISKGTLLGSVQDEGASL